MFLIFITKDGSVMVMEKEQDGQWRLLRTLAQ